MPGHMYYYTYSPTKAGVMITKKYVNLSFYTYITYILYTNQHHHPTFFSKLI